MYFRDFFILKILREHLGAETTLITVATQNVAANCRGDNNLIQRTWV